MKSIFACIYEELTLLAAFRAAHRKNDHTIAVAYGFADIFYQ